MFNEFLKKANKINWQPLKLGKVIPETVIKMKLNNKFVNIDGTRLRNLYDNSKGDNNHYLNKLLSYYQDLISN